MPFSLKPRTLLIAIIALVGSALVGGIGAITTAVESRRCRQTSIDVTSASAPVPIELQSLSFCPDEYVGDNAMTIGGFAAVDWGKPFVATDRTFVATTGKRYLIGTSWCLVRCHGVTPKVTTSNRVETTIPGTGCYLLAIRVEQRNGGPGVNTAYALVVSDDSVDVSTCPLQDTSRITQP